MRINAQLEALGHVVYNSIRKACQDVMESLLEDLSAILFTYPLANLYTTSADRINCRNYRIGR